MGGSEEAVVFVSRELARLGHRVEVYNECADGDLGLDAHGVRWLRHATYDHTTPPDVFVAWRYHISTALAGADRPKRIYAWLQDVPGYDSWTPDFVEGLSGIFTLSKFHTRTLPAHARYKARETPNGIDLSFIVEGDNRWDVFAYGSAPNRGLYDVLRIWPAVRERLPNATLVVYPLAAPNIFGSPRNTSASSPRFGLCGHPRHLAAFSPRYYGFSAAVVKWGRVHVPRFDEWREEVERLLQQPGVAYEGMVDHEAAAPRGRFSRASSSRSIASEDPRRRAPAASPRSSAREDP